MKRLHLLRLTSTVLLAGTLLVLPAHAAVQSSSSGTVTIVPNASIGAVKLASATVDQVVNALGPGAAANNAKTQVTLVLKTGGRLLARFYGRHVVDIETSSPAFSTTNGIHVGSSAAEVTRAFPRIKTNKSSYYLVGATQMQGGLVHTFFDLDNKHARVVSIRMGFFPWLTACYDPTGNLGGGKPTDVYQIGITGKTDWTTSSCPYIVHSGLSFVQAHGTLSIDPGVIVRFGDSSGLETSGGDLIARGTADMPVIFSSVNDQTRGAIAPYTGKAPHNGDWVGLGIGHDGGTITLDHVVVAYSGQSLAGHNAGIYLAEQGDNKLSVQNSLFADNGGISADQPGYGIDASTAASGTMIKDNTFSGNDRPLLAGPGLLLDNSNVFSPRGMSPNRQNAVFLPDSMSMNKGTLTLSETSVPFVFSGEMTIQSGATLVLNPGVILKAFNSASFLHIAGGILLVHGSGGPKGHPVVITSLKDDPNGGDTNADGAKTKARPGDWIGLGISESSTATINSLRVLYGGQTSGSSSADLNIGGDARVAVQDSEIGLSASDGIALSSTQPIAISQTSVHDSAGFGIGFDSTDSQSRTTLKDVTFGQGATKNIKGNIGVAGAPVQ
jgi:hypothetical protein